MNWLQDENTATAGGPGSDNELMSPTPHIVQFRKAGQQSFTICLTFPDSSSVNRPFTVHQLRGKSRKHIRSSASVSSNSGGELSAISDGNSPVCIESQCSHVSLVLQYQPMIITSDGDQPSIDNTNRQLLPVTPAVEINYQFALDQSELRINMYSCRLTACCNSMLLIILNTACKLFIIINYICITACKNACSFQSHSMQALDPTAK